VSPDRWRSRDASAPWAREERARAPPHLGKEEGAARGGRVAARARHQAEVRTEAGLFTYDKALPLGLTYPYDWGFVAGTRAEDGDPLDALVLTDVPSYPGVIIPSRVLGMLQLDERPGGKRKRNDRLAAIPLKAERLEEVAHPSHLPAEQREELEQFFLSTTFHTHKEARVLGWKGVRYAEKKIRKVQV
jgi:inorganic pyrophosphatase